MASKSKGIIGRKALAPIFHLQTKSENNEQLSAALLKNTRQTGKLNLSGRNLSIVPEKLWRMYEPDDEASINYDIYKTDDQPWWNFQPLKNLDLSSNCLNDLPGGIKLFQDLQVLNLNDNVLTHLPTELRELTRLTKLNVCHNKLTILPECVFKLTELMALLLSYNNIEEIPKEISDLVMLQEVDFSHNSISILPPGLGYMVRLTQANFSHNKLQELPPDIVNMRVLLKLDVTNNQLTDLPPMGELRKLQILYATHNNIMSMPDCEGCESLQEIYLGNNFISELTPKFCETMSHLKVLDLRDNKIEELPHEIFKIQQLTRLDISNNNLSNLPSSLGYLTYLQSLRVEGNKIRSIRRDIIQCGTSRLLKFLRERCQAEQLDIEPANETDSGSSSSSQLDIFPDKFTMANSHTLNMSSKQLVSIPDEVFLNAKEAKVKKLDFSRNKFQHVPEKLAMLSELVTELSLCVNLISSVPEFIGQFDKLQYLNISGNYLTELPTSFSNLNKIREFVISNNKFDMIPPCVYEMQGLEILLASDNHIKNIDVDDLVKIKRLSVLDLSNNNLENIPPELGNMTQLRSLLITGNSFRQPRYAILVKGTDAILAYLRDRIPS